MSDLQAVEKIVGKSASNQSLIPCESSKPLKGKYDGRGKYDRTHLKLRPESKPGPKPLYIKHLSRNSAAKVLVAFDLVASLSDIYKAAFEQNKLELCVQMRENALNRAYGRPFQASDPNSSNRPNVLEDKRLQVAIQQLVVTSPKALTDGRK